MRERSLGKVASSTGSQNQRQSSVQSASETACGWASFCTSRKTVKARRTNIGTSVK
jgi:hypothetical protein